MLAIDLNKTLPADTDLEGTAPAAGSDEASFARHAEAAFQQDAAGTPDLAPLSERMLREFSKAEVDRRTTEERWLKSLRQYKGQYDPEIEKAMKGHSKAFVRKTRVKVKTVDSRVGDMAFPAGAEKNWSLDASPKPQIDPQLKAQMVAKMQQAAQGQQPPDAVVDDAVKEMATTAAKAMSTTMEDQLAETHYQRVSLAVQHSGHLYGTGIMKGPLVERRVRIRFVQNGADWQPKTEEYLVPFLECVPVWRWYPDMNNTELEQCSFVYERHIFTKPQMLDLSRRKTFDGTKIREYVLAHPEGLITHKSFDSELKTLGERYANQTTTTGQFEVLERWGWLDGQDLVSAGVVVPPGRIAETFFSNIWMLPNGVIIKAVLQPITGTTWPYNLYYFDKDETSIFADGIPDVMRDDQENLNAAIRMMLDNGGITSGPMVEIFLDLLAKTEKAEDLGPWKVYLRNGKDRANPAVRPIDLKNNLEWLQPMAKMFDDYADETTAVPKYMSGDNATQGAAGTARGMSMLMGATNIVIKDLLTDWDEVTRNFLTALYRWNMQFNSDPEIKGDFDVKIRGTASLVAKEVRAQQLDAFAQATANPMDAPFIKRKNLLRQRAQALEMSDVVMSDDEIEAEQNSEQAKTAQEQSMRLREAQVAEQEAKAGKLVAETEVAKKKVDEMLANIDERIARTVQIKVDTIFAALQAGGVATVNPETAPAGDEVLRSAGYVDVTPSPSIAQLDGPPVQSQATNQALLNKGQSFVADPRATGTPGTPQTDAQTAAPANAPQDVAAGVPSTTLRPIQPGPASDPQAHSLPTAGTGEEHGIQTTRIERT